MDESDFVRFAGMAVVYGLYRIDLWRRARRVSDWAAQARRKVKDA
jgi:hypothetical protein